MPKPSHEDRIIEFHLHIHIQDGGSMATDLTHIRAEAAETKDVMAAAASLIRNLAQLLRDAVASGGDVTAEVNEIADSLDAGQADLSAAIVEGTPADPNATP